MVRIFLILTTILANFNAFAQLNPWQDPSSVAIGKEPARSVVKSYNSNDGALRQGGESLYLQPLSCDWKSSDSGLTTIHEHDFKVPFAWVDRHILLHLDAVGAAFEVFVNDQKIGYSQSTGTPSEFDIARYTLEGRNSLRVVVHRDHAGQRLENYLPTSSGALGKDNYVIAQPKVRVRDFVTDTRIEAGSGLLSLGIIVKTQLLNTKEVKVYYDLIAPDGRSATSGNRNANFDMRGEDTVRFFASIPNVKQWSHEAPNLYTLTIKTQNEGRFMEYISFKIGFRSVEMAEGKLIINGKPVELVIAEYSSTDSMQIMQSELLALKQKGANTIKVKHRPQSGSFYDLCDELGLYVCDQAAVDTHLGGTSRRKEGNISNDPQWENSFTDRALRMYHNSKNHPSVVMFSIADNSANGYNLYQSYLAMKSLEQQRPVIYLGAKQEWNSDAQRHVSFDPAKTNSSPTLSKYVTMTDIDAKRGVFGIRNNYLIKTLENCTVNYQVKSGKRVMGNGKLNITIAPESTEQITIPLLKIKPGTELEITLTVDEPIVPLLYIPVTVETQEPSQQQRILASITSLVKRNVDEEPNLKQIASQSFRTVY